MAHRLQAMDKTVTPPVCPACANHYVVRVCNPRRNSSILATPLLLPCGHTMCSKCVNRTIRQKDLILCSECKVLHQIKFSKLLPRNVYLLGLISDAHIGGDSNRFNFKMSMVLSTSNQVQLSAKFNQPADVIVNCKTCSSLAHLVCSDCAIPYCGPCFSRRHLDGSFSRHTSMSLSSYRTRLRSMPPTCKIPGHENRSLDFYCTRDNERVCTDCMLYVHKGHDFIKWSEKFKKSLEDHEVTQDILKNTIACLKFSEKNIAELRKDATDADEKCIKQIRSRFQDLHAMLQLRESVLIAEVKQNLKARDTILCDKLEQVKQRLEELCLLKLEMEKCFHPHAAHRWYETSDLFTRLDAVKDLPCYFALLDVNTFASRFSCEDVDWQIVASVAVDSALESLELQPLDDSIEEMLQEEDSSESLPDLVLLSSKHNESFSSTTSLKSQTSTFKDGFESCEAPGKEQQNDNQISCIVRDQKSRSNELVAPDCDFDEPGAEVVRVVYIVTPEEFYVLPQRVFAACDAMSAKLYTVKATDLIKASDVITNQLYLSNYKRNEWRRTRVLSATEEPVCGAYDVGQNCNIYHVFYIDFGTSDVLHVECLYDMPDEYAVHSPFAVRCSLFSIKPFDKSNEWSVKAICQFKKYVQAKEVMMTVKSSAAEPDGVLQVDISEARPVSGTITSTPQSVRDALVFVHLAIFSYPVSKDISAEENRSTLSVSNVNPCKIFSFHPPCLPNHRETFQAQVSWVNSPTDFYVQRMGEFMEPLESLITEMQSAYADHNRLGECYPVEGLGCVVKYEDGNYYRAKVVGSLGENRIHVFYVDFGNTEEVACADLLPLLSQFQAVSELAIPCSMADILPPNENADWPRKSSDYFTQFVANKFLNIHVEAKIAKKIVVSVNVKEDLRTINLNSQLVYSGLADSSGLGSQLVPVKTINKSTRKTSSEHFDEEDLEVPRNNKGEPLFQTKALVTYVESPSSIYIHMISDKHMISDFMQDLHEKYTNSFPSKDVRWEVEAKCVVLAPIDNNWYRAVIEGINTDGTVFEVLCVDYGMKCSVTASMLREIVGPCTAPESFAHHCHISGIVAPGGSSKWPSVTTEFLIEILSKFGNKIYLTKIDEIKDEQQRDEDVDVQGHLEKSRTFLVDLYVKEVIPKGALEPIVTSYKSVADELLDKGLALPSMRRRNEQRMARANLIAVEDETEVEVPSNNVFQCFEKDFLGPVDLLDKDSDSDNFPCNDVPFDHTNQLTCEFQRWLSPKIPREVGRRFQAIPTYVSNDGLVIMHDVEEGSRLLTLLESTLKVKYENSEPRSEDFYWFPGQACIAEYTNGQWYRGKIVTVMTGDINTLTVEFIDYGNTTMLRADQVRKNICFIEYPQIAFACRLFNVKPSEPDGNFTVQQLNYMNQQLENKMVWVTIKDPGDEGAPPAVVIDLLNNVSLNDILVSAELARLAGEEDTRRASVDSSASTASAGSNCSQIDHYNLKATSPAELEVDMNIDYVEDSPLVVGSKEVVTITHVVSPTMIYVHKDCIKNSKVLALRNNYRKAMSHAQDWEQIEPKIGMPCCAKNSITSRWNRATILAFDEVQQLCTVFFVDSGKQESQHVNSLRQLPNGLLLLPKQAIQCELHHLKPSGDVWTEELVKKLSDILLPSRRKWLIEVKGGGNPVPVELKTISGELAYQTLVDNNDVQLV